jgi:D-alanyl-D-alanine carboxypeptidase
MIMSNFYTDIILKSSWAHNPGVVCKDIAMLEPGTRAKVQALIGDAKASGHDIRVMETYRSQARQTQLFHEGKTQLSKVGCHGFGVAADLGLFIGGNKYDPRGQDYMFFEALCAKHKLISGINWGTPHAAHSFRDYDHVQNVPVFRQNELFAGRWYPPPDYDPIEDMIRRGVKGT